MAKRTVSIHMDYPAVFAYDLHSESDEAVATMAVRDREQLLELGSRYDAESASVKEYGKHHIVKVEISEQARDAGISA